MWIRVTRNEALVRGAYDGPASFVLFGANGTACYVSVSVHLRQRLVGGTNLPRDWTSLAMRCVMWRRVFEECITMCRLRLRLAVAGLEPQATTQLLTYALREALGPRYDERARVRRAVREGKKVRVGTTLTLPCLTPEQQRAELMARTEAMFAEYELPPEKPQ